MKCPKCGEECKVIDSRFKMPKHKTRDVVATRRRQCKGCEEVYYTMETVYKVGSEAKIIKKKTMTKKERNISNRKEDTKEFIESFVDSLRISKEATVGDKIYYRMIYENKNPFLELSKQKLFKVMRNKNIKETKIKGVKSFFVKA